MPAEYPKHKRKERTKDAVVVQRRSCLYFLAVQPRMFLIQKGIEHAFALLSQADPPLCGTQGMNYDGIRSVNEGTGEGILHDLARLTWLITGAVIDKASHQRENEIAVLSPGRGEVLIKATDDLQTRAAIKAVGCDKLGIGELCCIALVICRDTFQRYNESP